MRWGGIYIFLTNELDLHHDHNNSKKQSPCCIYPPIQRGHFRESNRCERSVAPKQREDLLSRWNDGWKEEEYRTWCLTTFQMWERFLTLLDELACTLSCVEEFELIVWKISIDEQLFVTFSSWDFKNKWASRVLELALLAVEGYGDHCNISFFNCWNWS